MTINPLTFSLGPLGRLRNEEEQEPFNLFARPFRTLRNEEEQEPFNLLTLYLMFFRIRVRN